MVVVFDIGNSNIHCGLYRGEKLVKNVVYPLTERALWTKISRLLRNRDIVGSAIASVVPRFTTKLKKFLRRFLTTSPIVVTSDLNYHLRFGYHDPKTLGADRIANVVGGLARYNKNLIIADFGTATTLDIVLRGGHYLGGIIAPGVEASLDALAKQTALLRSISFRKPHRMIGRSTEECIRSGVYYGGIAMARGLIQEVRRKYRKKFYCIAVGGWAKMITAQIKEIKCFVPDLTLYGVLRIYYDNI